MNVVFEIANTFEEDLKNLSDSERQKVEADIRCIFQEYGAIGKSFSQRLYRPRVIHLDKSLESSLSCLEVDSTLCVVLTVDEDPIFNQVIVTLLRAVTVEDSTKAFDSVAESLYQQELALAGGE